MRVTLRTRVVGTSVKTSRTTGNPYSLIAFMDGGEVVSAMGNKNLDIRDIKPFEEYELELDINMGKYIKVEVTGCQKI